MPRACCSAEWNRQGVLTDRAINCSFYLGCPERRAAGRKDSTSAMGQLCCLPFPRDEEKISELENPSSTVLKRYRKDRSSWPSGKKPIGIRDLINEALHRERMSLKSKVKEIKELLLKPETQAKIRRELFEGRSINISNQGSDVHFSTTLT